jgi:hypothetical protein
MAYDPRHHLKGLVRIRYTKGWPSLIGTIWWIGERKALELVAAGEAELVSDGESE